MRNKATCALTGSLILFEDRLCTLCEESDISEEYHLFVCNFCHNSRRIETFYLTTHSTHFIYCYMVSDMVKDQPDSEKEREETRCHHMGCSFRLEARVLLYASSHRQENTYHGLCYTSRGATAGTRNSSMGSTRRIDPTTNRTMSERSYHGATSRSRLH